MAVAIYSFDVLGIFRFEYFTDLVLVILLFSDVQTLWYPYIFIAWGIKIKMLYFTDTCQLYTESKPLIRDGCVSVGNVTYNYCSGGCGDSVNKPMLLPEGIEYVEAMIKDCSCCTGNIGGFNTVQVQCEGIDGIISAKIPVIDKCECNKCVTTGT